MSVNWYAVAAITAIVLLIAPKIYGALSPAARTRIFGYIVGGGTGIGRYFSSIVLLIGGILIFLWGIMDTPKWSGLSFVEIGEWSPNHWIPLLVVLGIYIALVNMHFRSATARVLTRLGVVVVVGMLVAAPAWKWWVTPSAVTPAATTAAKPAVAENVCRDAVSSVTRSCLLREEWSNWLAIGDHADNGKQICFSKGIRFERRNDVSGRTFWRFKTDNGTVVMKYRMFDLTTDCAEVTL